MSVITIGDGIGEARISAKDMKTALIAYALDLRDSLANETRYIPTTDKRYQQLKAIKAIFEANNITVNFEV